MLFLLSFYFIMKDRKEDVTQPRVEKGGKPESLKEMPPGGERKKEMKGRNHTDLLPDMDRACGGCMLRLCVSPRALTGFLPGEIRTKERNRSFGRALML